MVEAPDVIEDDIMAISTTPVAAAAVQAGPSARQALLDSYRRESATTLKILRAFPPEHAELRPHPTSNSAQQLAWTFAIENTLIGAALRNELRMPPAFPPMPSSWDECVDAYAQGVDHVTALLTSARDEDMSDMVPFMTGPRQFGDVSKLFLCTLMLNDSIHHRGQLSVYLRMSGAKVPSIYGPSRDEPWM
jgi:uncharacterized damage-inducible protein DinB